ncbi:hypothetical protein [Bacillus sp. LL01]|uniref:hypothetical protein n=1 Tax=Bacillus sp. LL01 TaxID=1665556 RepID=UPI000ADD7192|nr:hypothetical protein [Bacillus sp. LL01]
MARGVAYFLFAKGLTHVSSSTAVTLALAEPLTAALLEEFFRRIFKSNFLGGDIPP